MKITSYWQAETGYFDERVDRYTQRRLTDIKEKEIEVILESSKDNDKILLRFIGGPTGFESYYLGNLIFLLEDTSEDEELVICAGTLNSWPRCWVKVTDLKRVLSKLFYDPYEE